MLGYLSTQYMLEAIQKGAAGGPYDPAKTRQALSLPQPKWGGLLSAFADWRASNA